MLLEQRVLLNSIRVVKKPKLLGSNFVRESNQETVKEEEEEGWAQNKEDLRTILEGD